MEQFLQRRITLGGRGGEGGGGAYNMIGHSFSLVLVDKNIKLRINSLLIFIVWEARNKYLIF